MRADRLLIELTIALGLACASSGLTAQTLYRCGTTIQDKPCEGGGGQVIGQSQKPEKFVANIPSDAFCSQQGKSAVQLRWQKDTGKTIDEQLAAPSMNPAFIRYVYAKTGSAEEVRVAIEAECMESRKSPVAPARTPAEKAPEAPPPPNAEAPTPARAPVPVSPTTEPNPSRAAIRFSNESASTSSAPPGTLSGASTSASGTGCTWLNNREKEILQRQGLLSNPETLSDLKAQLNDIKIEKQKAGC